MQERTQFLEKQVINRLKRQDIYFVVVGNGKVHIKKAIVLLILLITIMRKMIHLCAIEWDLLIWSIKFYV